MRDLLPAIGSFETVYFSLDDPDERLRLAADPVRRLDHGDRIVILDEVQKQPALLDVVKLLADRGKGHRFLLLGSSQILLLQKVRETLAGRATLLELWPLALAERATDRTVPSSGLDRIWQDGRAALKEMAEVGVPSESTRAWRERAEEQFLWGGYPGLEPLTREERLIWLRFALAQNLLAARTTQLLSYSEVSRELGVAVNTVKRYLRFLEISYQALLLRPLLPTVTARLVKSPKLHWADPGLARLLSDRMGEADGAIYETALVDELVRWSSWQPDPPKISFHRTSGGQEVDVIVHSGHRLLAIEAKSGQRAHHTDARSLARFLNEVRVPGLRKDAQRVGLVVTRGREVIPLGPLVWAIPYWRLFGAAD